MIKGGNLDWNFDSRTEAIHDVSNRDTFLMKKLTNGIPDMSKGLQREGLFDIYKNEIPPENTDNLDVAKKHTTIRKK